MGLEGEANLTRTSRTGLLKESEVRAASKQAEEVIGINLHQEGSRHREDLG